MFSIEYYGALTFKADKKEDFFKALKVVKFDYEELLRIIGDIFYKSLEVDKIIAGVEDTADIDNEISILFIVSTISEVKNADSLRDDLQQTVCDYLEDYLDVNAEDAIVTKFKIRKKTVVFIVTVLLDADLIFC